MRIPTLVTLAGLLACSKAAVAPLGAADASNVPGQPPCADAALRAPTPFIARADGLAPLDSVPVPRPNGGDIVDFGAAVRLGKALFWDTQVGGDGQTACASCHFRERQRRLEREGVHGVTLDAGAENAAVEAQSPRAVRYRKPIFERLPEDEESLSPRGSKLGGYPTWVQSRVEVRCGKCKNPMRFVGQIDSGETGHNFGDVGIGYLVLCVEEHQAKFLAQAS